jgi:hypothetical protein
MILVSGEFKSLESQLTAAEAELSKSSGDKKSLAKKRVSELRKQIRKPRELYTGAWRRFSSFSARTSSVSFER